jgi:Zn-dependent membrane protease YugP
MSRLIQIKIGLAVAGILVLIWGLRVDSTMIRWIGIALLAASVLLRFVPKKLRQDDYPET